MKITLDLTDEISPKELQKILEDTIYCYAILQISNPNKLDALRVENHLYYLKLIKEKL